VTLFSFGATVRCDCGETVSAAAAGHSLRLGEPEGAPAPPAVRTRAARRAMEEISRGSDRIASMILYGDLPEVDVEIAIENLRARAEELFPGRGRFFEMLYISRFDRLRDQWGHA